MKNKTIVFLEDDEELRSYFSVALETQGYRVIQDCNSGKLTALLEKHRPALLISDLVMPEHEGIGGIFSIMDKYPIPIIAISSFSQYLQIAASVVTLTLRKPFSAEELITAVESVLAKQEPCQ
jgi:DNA-binding NtrC family response regulator